jgi:hypothetical protein
MVYVSSPEGEEATFLARRPVSRMDNSFLLLIIQLRIRETVTLALRT